jgi:hypothetical protein
LGFIQKGLKSNNFKLFQLHAGNTPISNTFPIKGKNYK